jgi:extracellular factor (EF) 3-hydroxypalmitic acid methyl ester biosynthesis protein
MKGSMSETAVEGWATTGGVEVPIRARYASRFSLWLEANGTGIGRDLDNLVLRMGERLVQVGPCRVLPEPEGRERVVSTGRISDFEKLFFHSRLESLDSSSLNLPLILGYKERIDPAFKGFVSDLTYDLNVHAALLDQLDDSVRDEPEAVRSLVREDILAGAGRGLLEYLERSRLELENIVSGFSAKEHEHHGFYFRRQLWNVILRAPIMARTNLKPRGYIGDSEMMRMIYRNGWEGETSFGRILHGFSLAQPAAQAVRNRRADVAHLVEEYLRAAPLPASERMRVLSVACGPALEVGDILRTPRDCARMHFSLLDQDDQALLEAGSMVGAVEKRTGTPVSADFIKESVRTMLVNRELRERWGQFHFIYSMGLFDYLTAPVAAAVMGKLYHLLKPGGQMVIGNLALGNSSRIYMEYWHDWKIIHRTEEDFRQLASALEGAELAVLRDETGIQLLLQVRKPVEAP